MATSGKISWKVSKFPAGNAHTPARKITPCANKFLFDRKVPANNLSQQINLTKVNQVQIKPILLSKSQDHIHYSSHVYLKLRLTFVTKKRDSSIKVLIYLNFISTDIDIFYRYQYFSIGFNT